MQLWQGTKKLHLMLDNGKAWNKIIKRNLVCVPWVIRFAYFLNMFLIIFFIACACSHVSSHFNEEYKALRLTGGLDRCAGRVEIHRNGTWGTVCDTCWQKEEATMACDMLNCGVVKHFTAFDPPFKHKNETLWYFLCAQNNKNLWQCPEHINNAFVCKETKAAGLICNSK